ncbi:hypothetical protein BOX15_Mlig007146g1 [Macrostomum lignano]|uniref:Fibrinogen C-terminal domain-containing protein n=1 Tax=Macrostomum lignano TaxID=282301 RepID=A0A267FEM3_9PLAT|nr:hypothetical protein BOX15_Mlig007146g1 [Macrostomum lignano]
MEARNHQNGKLYVCEYSHFSVGSASTRYRLSVSGYLPGSSNTSKDAFSYNNNLTFSTMDSGSNSRCSRQNSNAGWWYDSCTYVNPNGYFNLSEIGSRWNSSRNMQWLYAADYVGFTISRPMLRSIRLMLEIS